MKLIIDISKERYDEIMAMDWKNCRRFFDEEIRAIHDGKALEQEPSSSENPNKWIPVSERLPEPNQMDGNTLKYYLIQNEYGDMLVARYDGKGWEQIYQLDYLEDEVTAWMPLPEPYKASPTGAEGSDKE